MINETINKYLGEDKVLDYWNKVFADLDKRFTELKFKGVSDTNKVSSFLQGAMKLPQNVAMSVATDYADYRVGNKDKNAAVGNISKSMKRFMK